MPRGSGTAPCQSWRICDLSRPWADRGLPRPHARPDAAGPRHLAWLLEEVIIQVLDRWNITGSRIEGKPGVWIMTPEPQKIAFLGIRIEHGVTLHGFALNVDLDLTPFQRIHPCGFPDGRVTSMAAVCHTPVPVRTVKQELAHTFAAVFASTGHCCMTRRRTKRLAFA